MTGMREDLRQRLEDLDRVVPDLIQAHRADEAFSSAFAQQANAISADAGSYDHDWTLEQIRKILIRHGKSDCGYLRPLQGLPGSLKLDS
jgi:hypothetical protein